MLAKNKLEMNMEELLGKDISIYNNNSESKNVVVETLKMQVSKYGVQKFADVFEGEEK